MEILLKELMNCGILIYNDGAKFVLSKKATPKDARTAVNNNVVSDTSILEFETYDEALQEAKQFISWQEKSQAIVRTKDTCWFMQLMYRHKSGPKFADLGEMGAVTYEIAFEEAKKRANRYIEESCREEDIDGWDVRVRPLQPS